MPAIQLELPFDRTQPEMYMQPGMVIGKVYPVDGRWHAEIGGGWWIFVAGTRQAAIDGVTRIYQQEVGKVEI